MCTICSRRHHNKQLVSFVIFNLLYKNAAVLYDLPKLFTLFQVDTELLYMQTCWLFLLTSVVHGNSFSSTVLDVFYTRATVSACSMKILLVLQKVTYYLFIAVKETLAFDAFDMKIENFLILVITFYQS